MAGAAAGVGREVGRALRLALPFALLMALVNPLVYQGGDTLLVRGGTFLGRRLDITLEAAAAGAMAGLRIVVLIAALGGCSPPRWIPTSCCGLRRVSYRSALTAALATRLVPVLARDATRMGDAARCRPEPPGRLAVVRAAMANALDRAVDVAAALEVRGYALAGRPARSRRAVVAPRPAHRRRGAGDRRPGDRRGAGRGRAAPRPIRRSTWPSGPPSGGSPRRSCCSACAPFAGRAARLGVGR